MRQLSKSWLTAAVLIAASSALVRGAEPKKSSFETRFPTASPLGKYLGSQADAALDAAAADAESDTWNKAEESADSSFRLAVAYGSAHDLDAFREADFARRLLHQMQPMEPPARQDLLKYLRAHDELARLVAFTVRDGDDVPGVFALLDVFVTNGQNRSTRYRTLPSPSASSATGHWNGTSTKTR